MNNSKNGIMNFAIIALMIFSNPLYSKPVSDFFKKIEPLLIEKKYDEANNEFEKLSPKFKRHSIKSGSMKYLYENTVKWLKRRDDINQYLNTALKDINSYRIYNGAVTKKSCSGYCVRYGISSVDSYLPKTLPFSSEFVTYINTERKHTTNYLNSVISDLNEITEQNKKEKADAIKLEREKEKLAYQQKEENEKKAIMQEVSKLNEAAKSSGYAGYENENIISLIYKTQKDGGLEKYLNKVIGCHKLNKRLCERGYPKLKVIQILDQGVLYSFSEFSGGKHVAFTVFSDKVPGKIYQEGQAFENSYHVFRGMFSYKSVLGVNKTVPAFYKTKL